MSINKTTAFASVLLSPDYSNGSIVQTGFTPFETDFFTQIKTKLADVDINKSLFIPGIDQEQDFSEHLAEHFTSSKSKLSQ